MHLLFAMEPASQGVMTGREFVVINHYRMAMSKAA